MRALPNSTIASTPPSAPPPHAICRGLKKRAFDPAPSAKPVMLQHAQLPASRLTTPPERTRTQPSVGSVK